MKRSAKPKRTRLRSRYPDLTGWAELWRDGRVHVDLGVVHAPDGGQHWRIDGGDVLVEVETVKGMLDLTCRLGSSAGGEGRGLWRVPAVGEEVLVAIPDGDATFMPMIVATLSNNAAPDRVSDQRTILVATDVVEITAPKVILGPDPGSIVEETDGLVHGSGIDTFTGTPYAQLGNTTSKVFAKK